MKTITNLSGEGGAEGFVVQPVFHPSFGEEKQVAGKDAQGKPVNRVLRRAMQCGPEGLVFTNGQVQVAVPIRDLWELAESVEPGLKFEDGR